MSPYLQPGDTVALAATARKINEELLVPAIKELGAWGLKVVRAPHLLEADHQFAGPDKHRAAGLQWAIDHPDVKAIFCSRGGYGTMRILDYLDTGSLKESRKLICGFSDITTLHSLLANMGLPGIHCIMPSTWPENTSEAIDSLRRILMADIPGYKCPGHDLNIKGRARGRLVGGNLSLLYALTGTPLQIETSGRILFIEDLDEYLYHVDRMMQNLRLAGMLHHLAGMVVGGMTAMKDNDIPFGKSAEEIIHEAVARYGFPVCFGFPAGHISDNRALLMNGEYELIVEDAGASLQPV